MLRKVESETYGRGFALGGACSFAAGHLASIRMEYSLATNDTDLIRGCARVGEAEIVVCTDGTCLFDGGAMFGVVPKTLWSRKTQADDLNRIRIGLNCVVVKIGGKTLLIETGFGNKLSPKLRQIYGSQELLPASLAAANMDPGSIDFVLNTHLHWDHCSWNTTRRPDGTVAPMFPNAKYLAHGGEVEHGRLQLERDAISYVAENYEPLIASGQMELVQGDRYEVCEGVWMERFPGHTADLMAVHIESQGEHACFVSDLIPTSAHLDLVWTMGFDLDPVRTIAERKRFYADAVPGRWLVLFPHDHHVALGRLVHDERGRIVMEADTADGSRAAKD